MNTTFLALSSMLCLTLVLGCAGDDDGTAQSRSSATAADAGVDARASCPPGEHQLCLPLQHVKQTATCHCVAD